MAILYQDEYKRYIVSRGVGTNDKVASSVDSYLSYLRSVGNHLGIDVSPGTLSCEDDVQRLGCELEGVRKPRTIDNYISAMRQYVAMVHELELGPDVIDSKVIEDLDCIELDDFKDDDYVDNYDVDNDRLGKCYPDDKHFIHSSFREKLLEHLFVAELLKRSWQDHTCELEIAKPEVDSKGYDLIVENKGVVRHIQLKSTKLGGYASAQNIHSALGSKPSGCVVWMEFDEHTLEMGPFRYFGADAGHKLPPLDNYPVAKHTKANAEGTKTQRPHFRRVSKSQFELVSTMDELYRVLFG